MAEEMLDYVICSREQFSFQLSLESGDDSGTCHNWKQCTVQMMLNALLWKLSPADRVVVD